MALFDNRELHAFFALLKSGLWESEIDVEEFPNLAPAEWDAIYQMARQQTVTGLVYRGICHLPDELLPSDSQLMHWTAVADALELRNRRMNKALVSICNYFAKQGLTIVVLKGQGVAETYEYPLLRECGDIDLYFPCADEADLAIRLLRQTGCEVTLHADGSASYMWEGIVVEHHTQSVDLNGEMAYSWVKRMEKAYGFSVQSLGTDSKAVINIPTPVENAVLLNAHILKHALGWGVGLRQLCDLARLYHTKRVNIQSDEMREVCRMAGITRWTELLHSFLVEYLGMPNASLPFATRTVSSEPLLKRVMAGGNFGLHRGDMARKRSWRGKLLTACAFGGNVVFALRYAPAEAFRTFVGLMKGQFK